MYSCCMKVLRNAAPRSGSLLITVSVVFLCGTRLGGPDGCPENGPTMWGHPVSLERGGEGGSSHHGCSKQLSLETGKRLCRRAQHDAVMVSMAPLGERLRRHCENKRPQPPR